MGFDESVQQAAPVLAGVAVTAAGIFPKIFGDAGAAGLTQLQLQLRLWAAISGFFIGGFGSAWSTKSGAVAVEKVLSNQTALTEFPGHNDHLSVVFKRCCLNSCCALSLCEGRLNQSEKGLLRLESSDSPDLHKATRWPENKSVGNSSD
jgi:hypothetical protein